MAASRLSPCRGCADRSNAMSDVHADLWRLQLSTFSDAILVIRRKTIETNATVRTAGRSRATKRRIYAEALRRDCRIVFSERLRLSALDLSVERHPRVSCDVRARPDATKRIQRLSCIYYRAAGGLAERC